MSQISDGVFVEESNDMRVYTIEPHVSKHIKSFTSQENSQQKISLRKNAPVKKIADTVTMNGFTSDIDEHGDIHVKTENPVKLVKILCDANYIDIEQATAIIAYEIEHIRNPLMQKLLRGRQKLKEVREVVIMHQINNKKNGVKPPSVNNPLFQKEKDTGKF